MFWGKWHPDRIEDYEITFGDRRLMLDESINVHPGIPRSSVLYFYPYAIAEYHEQVRRNGLVVPDLDVTFYGMTEFRIEDPDGNRLWIGQNASAEAPTRHQQSNAGNLVT